jgi:hypothetical protein
VDGLKNSRVNGRLLELALASAGHHAIPGYPPKREIVSSGFGPRPLQGTRWITVAGGRDPNPERDGIPDMRHAAAWLKEQGAVVLDRIEDPDEGHGALVHNPKNAQRVLDLFLNENH